LHPQSVVEDQTHSGPSMERSAVGPELQDAVMHADTKLLLGLPSQTAGGA